jgi:hypothetical protein
MREQPWYIVLLIGLMCLVRFLTSAIGYIDPHWMMTQFGIPATSNLQMPYIIRVWAIRDIAISLLVVFANKSTIKTLLIACIAIDATDIVSAHLSLMAGLFNASEAWSLKLTAISALVPELAALGFIFYREAQEKAEILSPKDNVLIEKRS